MEVIMNGNSTHQPDSLDWLLDPCEPGVRYLALRDVLRSPTADPELASTRQTGPSPWPNRGRA